MTGLWHVLFFLLVPAPLVWVCRQHKALAVLSPVVLAYALGLLLGNLKALPFDPKLTLDIASGAVVLAIPLLLMSADFLGWLRLARTTFVSTLLCFGAVSAVAALSAPLFAPHIDEGWKVAGMLTGTYTGSSPNLVAVGRGLEAKPETIGVVVAADLLVGGLYALFLLSPGARLLGRLLPPFQPKEPGEDEPKETSTPEPELLPLRVAYPAALLLGAVIAGLGVAATLVVPKEAASVAAILTVTTLGVAVSFVPAVRANPASYPAGDYVLLVFCLAFGSLADLSTLASSTGVVLLWTTVVLTCGVAVHMVLCRILGIDRDTAIITSTSAIFNPAFIGPVVSNLRNPELLISGITAALFGIAVGNYLGLLVAGAVRLVVGS